MGYVRIMWVGANLLALIPLAPLLRSKDLRLGDCMRPSRSRSCSRSWFRGCCSSAYPFWKDFSDGLIESRRKTTGFSRGEEVNCLNRGSSDRPNLATAATGNGRWNGRRARSARRPQVEGRTQGDSLMHRGFCTDCGAYAALGENDRCAACDAWRHREEERRDHV